MEKRELDDFARRNVTARFLEAAEELKGRLGSYAKAARALGVSPPYLARLRAGDRSVGHAIAQRAADALEVDVTWFYLPPETGGSLASFRESPPSFTRQSIETPPDWGEASEPFEKVVAFARDLLRKAVAESDEEPVTAREAMILAKLVEQSDLLQATRATIEAPPAERVNRGIELASRILSASRISQKGNKTP